MRTVGLVGILHSLWGMVTGPAPPDSQSATLGGAINEKDKATESAPSLARLLHAQFGLDHYPNYLLRWREDEIDELESALEASLHEVRRQRALVRERGEAASAFVPQLDLSPSALLRDAIDPRLCDALGIREGAPLGSGKPDLGKLEALLQEEHEGIYSLPLLRPAFCAALLDEARRFYDWAETRAEATACLGVADRPIDLTLMGAGVLGDVLLRQVMAPLADLLYRREAMGPLDWRHAFLVGYAVEKGPCVTRTSLVSHTDDSEVTLNVCLGREFSGGELYFGALRGEGDEDEVVLTYQPQPGRAVIHPGRQLHAVGDVTGGQRFALICWARSRQGLRSRVCPCCFMNRRVGNSGVQAPDCICGPAWN